MEVIPHRRNDRRPNCPKMSRCCLRRTSNRNILRFLGILRMIPVSGSANDLPVTTLYLRVSLPCVVCQRSDSEIWRGLLTRGGSIGRASWEVRCIWVASVHEGSTIKLKSCILIFCGHSQQPGLGLSYCRSAEQSASQKCQNEITPPLKK